ncbi:hypothetical protein F2P45_25625 [Massilia sp. CCM 8733]|uniref:Transposase n=1 Tax=Massilia mucilaginosa TaxID=2609282 RepID=A0ABX0NZC4_9BURK|nr:hypothetical protein [Massilia mucilaginosa]NHZ92361.1 hypothetical protein [Massilia mucilaginosa]
MAHWWLGQNPQHVSGHRARSWGASVFGDFGEKARESRHQVFRHGKTVSAHILYIKYQRRQWYFKNDIENWKRPEQAYVADVMTRSLLYCINDDYAGE